MDIFFLLDYWYVLANSLVFPKCCWICMPGILMLVPKSHLVPPRNAWLKFSFAWNRKSATWMTEGDKKESKALGKGDAPCFCDRKSQNSMNLTRCSMLQYRAEIRTFSHHLETLWGFILKDANFKKKKGIWQQSSNISMGELRTML